MVEMLIIYGKKKKKKQLSGVQVKVQVWSLGAQGWRMHKAGDLRPFLEEFIREENVEIKG